MSAAIKEAKIVLDCVKAQASDDRSRGQRAHARAIATIEAAEKLAGIEKQLRIANLIASVKLGGANSVRARAEVDALLWGDVAEVEKSA